MTILGDNGVPVESMNRSEIDFSQPISTSAEHRIKSGNYQYVAICAAITDVEQCYRDQKLSEQVNVVATTEILKAIRSSGAVPIFFSSDYVFPNTVALHREEDRRAPETRYGQQKLAVELFIEKNFDRFLVFRTSKLMSMTSHSKNILLPVLQCLRASKPIRCFEDQWMNPVFVEDIAKVVMAASVQHLSGTFHLGTRKVFTRAELGRFLAKALGFDPTLIQSIKMSDIEFSEPRPTHNTLDCSKIEKALEDFRFTEIESALHDLHRLVE
jgi:dTDP-4-dehydrorhamnose reductase